MKKVIKLNIICQGCKTTFSVLPCYKIRKYCSHKCFLRYRVPAMLGKKHTPGALKKLSVTWFKKGHISWNNNLKGIHLSPQTEFKKGHKISFNRREEQRKLAVENGYGKWMRGRTPAFIQQGKHYQPRGDNHPRWKGGLTYENSKMRNSEQYKKWRRDIFIRDSFTCQQCGHRFIKIVAHHIKSFADYKDLCFNLDNGITLCRSCHCKIHNPAKKVLGGVGA